MIFKQWKQILDGTKTQTRRVVKPNETFYKWDFMGEKTTPHVTTCNLKAEYPPTTERLKWAVGRTYAVTPKRGEFAIWYRRIDDSKAQIWNDHHQGFPNIFAQHTYSDDDKCHWQQLRIRITDIRREPLQDISEEDAEAEGCPGFIEYGGEYPGVPIQSWEPTELYRDLWESINGKGSWDANPDVWVLTFELVEQSA